MKVLRPSGLLWRSAAGPVMIRLKGAPTPVQSSVSSVFPDAAQVLDAMDRTWPAHDRRVIPGWTLRLDPGGGKRVSAATPLGPGGDISVAEAAMRDAGQTPLFMLRPQDEALDAVLADRGYRLVDPVTIHAGPSSRIAGIATPGDCVCCCDFPLAVMAEIWAEGGIGPARLDVMSRAAKPRTWLLARSAHQPAGVAFVSVWQDLAMIHAIEIAAGMRRQGHGRTLLAAAANWAQRQGAGWLALAVTDANHGANALYAGAGMLPVTRYHYRQAPS